MAARPARSLCIALAIALPCLLSSPLAANAAAKKAKNTCQAAPIVVKIHADWCATCKALDSIWTQLDTDMGDRIQIVELDVSDRVAFRESQATAIELGVEEFFQEYRSKTGTVAVFDCNSREPVAIMNGERDLGKYLDAIAKASRSS